MALTPGFDQGAQERLSSIPGPDGRDQNMIRNGLYHITVEMLDGIAGGNQGVMVVRDGTLRGGDSFFYAYGTCACANGKWKGEVTNREHTPTFGARPVWERKVVTIGFTGTYADERRHRAGRQTERSIQLEAAFADSGLNGAVRARPIRRCTVAAGAIGCGPERRC
jgi:hypothetical protein